MSTLNELKTEECCPAFHPEKWEGKMFHWDHKPFIKESIPEFFHIPYPPMIAKRIGKMMKMAEEAGRLPEDTGDALLLFTDPSPFKGELYLSVTGEVPGAKNTTLSGAFATRVFDGHPRAIPKFIKKMDDHLDDQDQKADKYYVHYAYCPKCAEKEGHNYMVLFAKLKES